jgi:hypothetical protein
MMAEDMRLWKVQPSDDLVEIYKSKLNLENRIENWLHKDISIIATDLLVIARQLQTAFGGIIDLLCLDRNGDLVVVELKRDKTPRDITAQALDYASAVKDFSYEKIVEIANSQLGANGPLGEAFKKKFDADLPEVLNERHKMLIVASEIDAATERIVTYLSSTYGVSINVATFKYFQDDAGGEYVARTYLIEPTEVDYKADTIATTKSKRYLSLEELEASAVSNGVAELYRYALEELQGSFDHKWPSKSSIRLVGELDGSPRVIISLIPTASNAQEGLRFQVYAQRIMQYFGLDEERLETIMPTTRKDWSYSKDHDPWWSGWEGFFRTSEEIGRLSAGLRDYSAATAG